jgi:trimeric autotransporter adhesin
LAVGSTASGKNISVFSSANGNNGLIGIYQSNGTQEGQLYAGTGNVNFFGTSVVKIVASTGGVQLTSGATSWTSISDERAKDIIEPISNAVQKVSNLRSVIGKYKTDSEGTRRSFLIAQDVQAVFPEAVDTTDEDNLGVRYTETIPLLVAAIKEQQATIESLEARIAALES